MKITFHKHQGDPSLGIAFSWVMTIRADSPVQILDHFIPELFYDYFYLKEGNVTCVEGSQGVEYQLPSQALKTLYTRPLKFSFSTPLVLFGARFSLRFAESYWEKSIEGNSIIKQNWITEAVNDLPSFENRLINYIESKQIKESASLLLPTLEESERLRLFSSRHKRRLYKTVFGISKKEMWSIYNVHSFLEQTCDFTSQYPRIIQHVNAEVFYDQPHLNHAFKKMTGLSPLEYFEVNSILQDNLMAASYNEISAE
jgi:AraC-like DNA-binding protein